MYKNFQLVSKLLVFFLIISAFARTSHAIVVAPLIAVGLVKVLAILIGFLAIPISYLVKFFTKYKWLKTVLITLIIMALLFGALYTLLHMNKIQAFSPELGAPAPLQPQVLAVNLLTILGYISLIIFVPVVITMILINAQIKKWSVWGVILSSMAISVVGAVMLFIAGNVFGLGFAGF